MRPEDGLGFVRRMLDLGILNEKSSLVHFVWANDDDISAALDAGITVVHSPLSNAMLGAGVAPISKKFDKRVFRLLMAQMAQTAARRHYTKA